MHFKQIQTLWEENKYVIIDNIQSTIDRLNIFLGVNNFLFKFLQQFSRQSILYSCLKLRQSVKKSNEQPYKKDISLISEGI